jgi:nitrogenase molybdenum-iron protein alpha/beta subunit
MTTDLSDMDAIMGRGEKRLFKAIKQAVETYKPAAVFVYNTCVPAMQGQDIEAVAKAAAARFSVPVIPVDCAGFYGNKNLGNRIAGDAMYKHVIGTREPDPIAEEARIPWLKTHDINLIGEWNVGGEFWSVAPLFDELGLRILCTFSGDSRFREVQTMHRAEANMVVCSKAMLHVARKLKEEVAKRVGSALLRAGFPIYDAYGAHTRAFIGYAGSRQLLFEVANLLASHYQELRPHRSRFWQGTPRAQEQPTNPISIEKVPC